MKHFRTILSAVLCVVFLITTCSASFSATASPGNPQLVIDAGQNEGVFSPNVMGNMFEWASDYMNGSWAEKLSNRNFEIETLDFYASPLYDHFSSPMLDESKWSLHTYGSSAAGSVSIANSKLIINGAADARFGVLSQQINEKTADVTIKVELSGYTGTNAMVSLNAEAGTEMTSNIEFGIDAGRLKVFGDGIQSFTGNSVTAPVTLKIVVGHVTENGRNIRFYANNTLVHSVDGFTKISEGYKVFLYGWGNSAS